MHEHLPQQSARHGPSRVAPSSIRTQNHDGQNGRGRHQPAQETQENGAKKVEERQACCHTQTSAGYLNFRHSGIDESLVSRYHTLTYMFAQILREQVKRRQRADSGVITGTCAWI